MTPDPKYIIQLANAIEAAKLSLQALEAEWEAIFTPTTLVLREHPRTVTVRGDSDRGRILALVLEHPDTIWDANGISRVLETPKASTRTNLSVLAKTGKIWKVAEGQYAAIPEKVKEASEEAS